MNNSTLQKASHIAPLQVDAIGLSHSWNVHHPFPSIALFGAAVYLNKPKAVPGLYYMRRCMLSPCKLGLFNPNIFTAPDKCGKFPSHPVISGAGSERGQVFTQTTFTKVQ